MATFLLKTEPNTYSFADLVRQKKATWDGVTNAAALIQAGMRGFTVRQWRRHLEEL